LFNPQSSNSKQTQEQLNTEQNVNFMESCNMALTTAGFLAFDKRFASAFIEMSRNLSSDNLQVLWMH
jgi:hypothetical protein